MTGQGIPDRLCREFVKKVALAGLGEGTLEHPLRLGRCEMMAPRPGLEPGTCGLTGLPPRRNAPFGVGERDSTPLHAKGGLEEFGRLVGDTAQSAGAMQVNHRGVAADGGFCRTAPGALRVSFASKSIHAVLAPRAYGT